MKIAIIIICLFFVVQFTVKAQPYQEKYRPQFHFSPKTGWIGDVTGAIRYKDTYRLFWWGQATSKDLVYWNELDWPMKGDDGSFMYFTGSVVIDDHNTSAFGSLETPPMVAIYTMHNKLSGIQTQGISYSKNGNLNELHYYEGNPVIDSNDQDFRDPQVFWDRQTNRWIMVITRPLERSIEVYASTNLKNWTFLSEFAREGAQKEVWEVPDLFPLPLDGDTNNIKWVMTCGMGPNRTQYWVGDFNGTKFEMDSISFNYLHNAKGIEGEVFENFESGFDNWTIQGNAFGIEPTKGALLDQMNVSGFIGDYLANSFHSGDNTTGSLRSVTFTVTHNFINFLVSGGDKPIVLEIQLYVDDKLVKYTSGNNSEQLIWKSWDVEQYKEKQAYIKILDKATGDWGHINADQFIFSDKKMGTGTEHAYWADWGTDFYASKTFRDFDGKENRTVWMAWVNNWQYANKIPTSWGQSTCHSIPRSLHLESSKEQGYILVQHPIEELKFLRKDKVSLNSQMVDGVQSLTQFKPEKNTYEIEASFEMDATKEQEFGLNLCVDGNKKLVLMYDSKSSEFTLDRRESNDIYIPNFNAISTVPILQNTSIIKIHVFIDQHSAEVFINDGEIVLTSLIFPSEVALGIELFSNQNPIKLKEFNAWELKSIWEPVTSVNNPGNSDGIRSLIYPNPVKQGKSISLKLDKSYANYKVDIYSIQGEHLISEFHEDVHPGSLSINMIPGVYLLVLSNGNQLEKFKLFVN